MEKTGIIFDCDGILLNSQVAWDSTLAGFYTQTFPEFDEDPTIFRGLGEEEVFEIISKKYPAVRSREDHFHALDYFVQDIYKIAPMIDGVMEIITLIESLQLPKAIATASRRSWVTPALLRHNIHHRFSGIIGSEDVEKTKPAPDPYLTAAKLIERDPAYCIVLEDSRTGVRSAKAAGMTVIGLQSHEGEELEEADIRIKSLSEIDDYFIRSLIKD